MVYNNSSKRNRNQHSSADYARKFILIIIPIMIIIVVIAVACIFIFNPEQQVKSKLNDLASEYYENVFYENMLNSNEYSGNSAKSLAKYESTGLTPMKLHQLILLNENTSVDTDYITDYCNDEQTTIKYYPKPPYSKNSYEIEFTYYCNF